MKANKIKLTDNQKEIVSLIHNYQKLNDSNTKYYLMYINNFTKPSNFDPFNYNGDGYYVVRLTPTRSSIQTTRLNANSISSLINKEVLVKCKRKFTYIVDNQVFKSIK